MARPSVVSARLPIYVGIEVGGKREHIIIR